MVGEAHDGLTLLLSYSAGRRFDKQFVLISRGFLSSVSKESNWVEQVGIVTIQWVEGVQCVPGVRCVWRGVWISEFDSPSPHSKPQILREGGGHASAYASPPGLRPWFHAFLTEHRGIVPALILTPALHLDNLNQDWTTFQGRSGCLTLLLFPTASPSPGQGQRPRDLG